MKKKPSSSRPRTGDKRQVRQPLAIDQLPMEVHEAIKRLRDCSLGWMEIERLSSLPYGEKWEKKIGSAGFVDWDALPTKVLELFPQMKLSHSTLQRWYDIRVEQNIREVERQSRNAFQIGEMFAKRGMEHANEAVMNAVRDIVFSMLTEDDDPRKTPAQRTATRARYLLALGELMQEARKNEIRQQVADTDARRVEVLERDAEDKRKRMDRETESAAKKLGKGGVVTIDDINRLRERTFGLPPVAR